MIRDIFHRLYREKGDFMKEYLKASGIVIGALLLIGFVLLLWPVILGVVSVIWPILIVVVAIVIVAEYLRNKRK